MSGADFPGFPAVAKATAIPNIFFGSVLPNLNAPGDLLAFLWVARLAQEQQGKARCVSADQVWAEAGAAASFDAMGGGRQGLERGLEACVAAGALLGVRVSGSGAETTVFFVNNPQSRRAIARAQSGEIRLVAGAVSQELASPVRPGIFRIYEEHVGTITPYVAEKLLDAEERYPGQWIEDAFREAAEVNARNWRYVERILENWEREGRANEAPGRDTLEQRKRRFLGGSLGSGAAPR